jgi:hypothetical protein
MAQFDDLRQGAAWQVLVAAAKRAMESQGYRLTREPGRGLSNVYAAEIDGKKLRASIRTTRNRWFAFPPLERGEKFKTLSEVDLVVVAAVDSPTAPRNVEVFLFSGDEVRSCFRQAYDARSDAGHSMQDNFGMWVNLDRDPRDVYRVGSGLAVVNKPIAIYNLDELVQGQAFSSQGADVEPEAELGHSETPPSAAPAARPSETISDVLTAARVKIAQISGVTVDAVKIDLKIAH